MSAAPFVQIAPMEGVVDPILRELLTAVGGLDRTVTEFVRVTDRLLPAHVFYKYCPELHTGGKTASGVPVFIQLLGGQPEPLAENAHHVVELGAPGIDLNFGCPAKTVNRHDGGALLLKNPERLHSVITAVKGAVKDRVPVTAKVRLGYENKELHKEIAQAVSDAGADQLVIHARTKEEGYRPPAHWEFIASMKSVCRIPLVANGDIWTLEDYKRCVEISGVRDVALGRGLIARPDLARQIKQDATGSPAQPLSWRDLLSDFLPVFVEKSVQARHESFALCRLKQMLKFLSRGYPEAAQAFDSLKVERDLAMVKARLFAALQEDVWHESKFTPGPIAPIAFEPRIC